MTDFNDNMQNNTPAAQPEAAPVPQPETPAAQEPAPAVWQDASAAQKPASAPQSEKPHPVPELTVDPATAAEQIHAAVEALQDVEIPTAPEMHVPPAKAAAPESPFTDPAPQHPMYQQTYYQPPQYTQHPVPPYQPPQYTQSNPETPVQPDSAQGNGYQPPRYTQQYQPPYNEPQPNYQPPYQQPYQNPYQPNYQNPYQNPKTYAQKSRIATALLAILFGVFGIHNFYQGRIGIGIAQLAISVLSCFFLSPVSIIWSIVEGIQLLQGKKLVDGHGLPFID